MHNWTVRAESLVECDIKPQGIYNTSILDAMKKLPRHLFIPEAYREFAYEDRPIPIGENQTISQPFIVSKMTDMLELEHRDHVLEIGTGSGYQAAILAQMGMQVTTIERIEQLAVTARKVFADLGYKIESIIGDGREGYAPNAPYQGVIVTAGAPKVEDSWFKQLETGGRIVVPVAVQEGIECLLVRQKKADNQYEDKWFDYCRFVPLLPGIKPTVGNDPL